MSLMLNIKNALAHKKIWRQRIGDITSWRLTSGASWTCRIFWSWLHNNFKMFESIRNDSKTRTLKLRDVKWHLVTCEQLLQQLKRKVFLHYIVTGDEKWIHYSNLKHRRSWGKLSYASTSAAKPNIHGLKLLLCICWNQLIVAFYELLKLTKTITRSLSTTSDVFELSIEEKMATIQTKAWLSDIATWQSWVTCCKMGKNLLRNV